MCLTRGNSELSRRSTSSQYRVEWFLIPLVLVQVELVCIPGTQQLAVVSKLETMTGSVYNIGGHLRGLAKMSVTIIVGILISSQRNLSRSQNLELLQRKSLSTSGSPLAPEIQNELERQIKSVRHRSHTSAVSSPRIVGIPGIKHDGNCAFELNQLFECNGLFIEHVRWKSSHAQSPESPFLPMPRYLLVQRGRCVSRRTHGCPSTSDQHCGRYRQSRVSCCRGTFPSSNQIGT